MTDTSAATPQGQTADTDSAPQPEAINPEATEQAEAQPIEGEQETQPEQKPEGDSKPPKGVQKRLDELTRRANDERRLNERLIGLLEKSVLSGAAPKVEQAPSGPPQRDKYETFEDYLEAKADWQLAQKLGEIEQKAQRTKAEREVVERDATWKQKLNAAATKFDDFEDVVFSDGLQITDVMAEAMKDSDAGPEVAYYLGKNASEAERIAKLSPVAQVREIGKIEAQLNSKPARQASKAPAPIEPVGSGKTSAGNPDSMSQAEYEALRKKQGAWWSGRH